MTRRVLERPEKPAPREESNRPWVSHGEEDREAPPSWRPTLYERMCILLDSLCGRWPAARRALVAHAHAGHLANGLAAIPTPTWGVLLECKVQGRPCPPRHRRVLAQLLAPLVARWSERDRPRW